PNAPFLGGWWRLLRWEMAWSGDAEEGLMMATAGDDGGDDGVRVVAIGVDEGEGGGGCGGVMEAGAAHDGEWYMGANRSGGREHFWFWPEDSPENFFGEDGWPEMVVAGGRIGRKLRRRWSVCYIFLL
nr:hypothetical protein [Tanacetum cinerariifolium]